MLKAKLLKIVNPILILNALVQALSGLILFLLVRFPNFPVRVPYLDEIHSYAGLALSALIIIHFILNWAWVKNTFFSPKKQKGA
jgi:hypothetical protein